uniref:Uncharacterized protein n=1 Tax=Candidatus Kentrum sp. TC TaxID=2126339 RepID=A0A450Z5D7_9GAMM|nr:MAG: hypothetical protein BECKTC1821E_GA0114239_11515 [Candidatus Kentron sp. TC]
MRPSPLVVGYPYQKARNGWLRRGFAKCILGLRFGVTSPCNPEGRVICGRVVWQGELFERVDVSGSPQHFVDFVAMQFLFYDHFSCIFFQKDGFAFLGDAK